MNLYKISLGIQYEENVVINVQKNIFSASCKLKK